MDTVCVIAAPGSGADRLCEALGRIPDLASYPAVFGSGCVHGVDAAAWPLMRKLTGIAFTDNRDARLVDFVHQRPAAWLDVLEIAARDGGRRVMGFTLCHDDLPLETIERELVPRTGMRVMLVVRRQIDSYVAWRKTVAMEHMAGAGRLSIRLKLDPERFEQWMEAQERWYAYWRDSLKRRFFPCPVLRFESDIDRQPAEAMQRRFAAAAAQLGITLKPPVAGPGGEAPPPLRLRNLSEDVRNWTEFSAEIFRRGLEKRAFGYPI